MNNKVVLFEIPASNLKKAKEFYESIFDWKVNLWEDEGAMALTTAVDKDEQPIELGGIKEVSTNANQKPTIRRSAGKPVRLMSRSKPSRRLEERPSPRNIQSANGALWRTLQIRRATSSHSGKNRCDKPMVECIFVRFSCRLRL